MPYKKGKVQEYKNKTKKPMDNKKRPVKKKAKQMVTKNKKTYFLILIKKFFITIS